MKGPERADELTALIDRLRQHLGDDLAVDEAGVAALAEAVGQVRTPGSDGRTIRWQDAVILAGIPTGARVLDLGCGDGQLLASLSEAKDVRGQGVELDLEEVAACFARGVPVLQSDIDEGLRGFADTSFDYVVLEETLQTLHRPLAVLEEMLRVGRIGIVSFPNFACWRVRLDLLLNGRMPTTRRLPYEWHDTPNIHHLTIADFLDWCSDQDVRVVSGHVLDSGETRPYQDGDNVQASEALFFVER